MVDNVIPFIKGEEEKPSGTPQRLGGSRTAKSRTRRRHHLSALHPRAGVGWPHGGCLGVLRAQAFEGSIRIWKSFSGKPQALDLPSAPKPFLTYFEDEARPQTRLDRDIGKGMGVAIGRLRGDSLFDYRFVLSHNTVRGAAGGAVLSAELLTAEGYLSAK